MMRGHVEAMASEVTDQAMVHQIKWIDSIHIIFTSGDWETQQLRLTQIGHASLLIAELSGVNQNFGFDN
jgi:hypothetical protein